MEEKFSDYERGWLEATLDGEGALYILRRRYLRFDSFIPRTNIVNTSLNFVNKAQKICGGGSISSSRGTNKPVYVLFLSPNVLRRVLPQLTLVVKEKQRLLLLNALSLIRHGGFRPESTVKRLEEIYLEVKRLNAS